MQKQKPLINHYELQRPIFHYNYPSIRMAMLVLKQQKYQLPNKCPLNEDNQMYGLSQIHSFLTKDIKNQSSQKLKKQLSNNRKNNRVYSKDPKDKVQGFKLTFYTKPLIYAGQPYFCPNGWKRYSLDVGLSNQEFKKKYQNWPVAYHGTNSTCAFSIIANGFKSNKGCWIGQNQKAVYLTPSIIYASHPRYSKIQVWKNMHVQVILQLRVKKQLFVKKPGTLKNAYPSCKTTVDPNYSNNQLQWVCKWNSNSLIQEKEGIIIYGIMLKISAENPVQIKENDWYTLQRNQQNN